MPQITVIAHNIRSTYNIGSIFRTAEGFGVAKIVLSGYTPYPDLAIIGRRDPRLPHLTEKLTAQIHKTALGAERMVPFQQFDNLEDWFLANQHSENLPVVALEQSKRSIMLPDFQAPVKFALLLGEEVDGVAPEHLARCSTIVEIPMFGQKESFNVSVACGVALYELAKS